MTNAISTDESTDGEDEEEYERPAFPFADFHDTEETWLVESHGVGGFDQIERPDKTAAESVAVIHERATDNNTTVRQIE